MVQLAIGIPFILFCWIGGLCLTYRIVRDTFEHLFDAPRRKPWPPKGPDAPA
jgi:hypothetical protein